MLDNIIGVEEAARLLNLSPGTVKNYCADGKITAKKIGKTWVLDKTKLEGIRMTKINELHKLIEESGKELDERIEFENDGGRDIIIVCDDDAETSDEYFIHESHSAYEALEFLTKEGYLK